MPSKYASKLSKPKQSDFFKEVQLYRDGLGVCSNCGRTGAFAPSQYHRGANKQIRAIPCRCGGVFQRIIGG